MTDAFPGQTELRLLNANLPHLSLRQRVAFAVACAERVLPLAVDPLGKPWPCREAVDLAWRFAEGDAVSSIEVRAVSDACQLIIDQLYDEDELGYPLEAVRCAASALDTVTSGEWETALNAAEDALAAAQIDDEDCDAHIAEEAKWQILALEVVKSAPTLERNILSHLPSNPQWLQRFRQRIPV